MWTLLIAIAGAGPEDLAPTPSDVQELLRTQERLIGQADSLGTATQRLHNAAGRSLAKGADCRAPEVRSLLTRSRHLGEAWRDALQSARALQPVIEERAAQATVAPLLEPDLRMQITATGTTLGDHATRYAEAVAWQRSMAPDRCLDDETLATAAAGLSEPTGRPESAAAVLLAPGSTLCPSGRTAPGVAILSPAMACVVPEGRACDCVAAPVAPGAVLAAPPANAAPGDP